MLLKQILTYIFLILFLLGCSDYDCNDTEYVLSQKQWNNMIDISGTNKNKFVNLKYSNFKLNEKEYETKSKPIIYKDNNIDFIIPYDFLKKYKKSKIKIEGGREFSHFIISPVLYKTVDLSVMVYRTSNIWYKQLIKKNRKN